MKLEPVNDHVVVERFKNNSVSKGGIVLPESATATTCKGIVRFVPKDGAVVVEGDKVLFGKYAGTEFKMDDVDYLLLKETEIIARVTND